ncbi:hypothetical protein [Xanthomonas floridensis]|uniref:Uncharacterized protein n=1 Tax=Xanthomonas floridensis TaxID=1843580 RepID=A0A1A9MCF0_9XANT|nr:hypothetical protein [Xanthomonas floridensis]MEA5123427.1 hypothetical protein [Xanthomonas floridensis]MEA5133110.1 hypothetical protein [Xanthomonas floridensis]OAG67317.1 hypothetical protein A7D17_18215 [Xanthomonas floridensis]
MGKLREEVGHGKPDHATAQHAICSIHQNGSQAYDEDGSPPAPRPPTKICMQGGHIGRQPLGYRTGIGV